MLSPSGHITLAEANEIATAAIAHARSENMAPITVAVVDAAGTIRCLQCEDGSALLRPDIAYAKAWGCVGIGFSTRAFHAAHQAMPAMGPAFQAFTGLAEHRLVASPGGVLILRGDEVVGAVGVSGDQPDKDEACALAGIASVGLQQRI